MISRWDLWLGAADLGDLDLWLLFSIPVLLMLEARLSSSLWMLTWVGGGGSMTWEGLKVLWEPSKAGNLAGVGFGLVSGFLSPEESVRTVCTKGDSLDLSEGSFDTGD